MFPYSPHFGLLSLHFLLYRKVRSHCQFRVASKPFLLSLFAPLFLVLQILVLSDVVKYNSSSSKLPESLLLICFEC